MVKLDRRAILKKTKLYLDTLCLHFFRSESVKAGGKRQFWDILKGGKEGYY